jgi:hypothetical protein
MSATFAPVREKLGPKGMTYAIGALAALVILAILLLPPVSLLERLGIVGYTTVNAENNSTSLPNNLTLSVDPETFAGRLKVKLSLVHQSDFLIGDAGAKLEDAARALPSHMVVKSPVYKIKVRGKADQPVMLDVVIPNDAEPWETLDLYTWTGEAWKWVGGELHTEVAEHEFLRAQVTDRPENLVVVQMGHPTATVAATLETGENPLAMAGIINEINPVGLLLGPDGSLVGDPNGLPSSAAGSAYTVLPTLRNWTPDKPAVPSLLQDVLENAAGSQENHIANIVKMCQEQGFAGVDVDYRGISIEDKAAYSAFIKALADGLHAAGYRLTVVVEPPQPTNGGWETGGYDWKALGAVADGVKIPFPEDPTTYIEGGLAQRLLNWATGQISRQKVYMMVSSLSAEQSSDNFSPVSLEHALAPFGQALTIGDITQVEPNSQVEFALSGSLRSIMPYEEAGTYRLEYESDDGSTRAVWLGTAANLAAKLRWARQYHLGGVAIVDIFAAGNAPSIADAISSYHSAAASPASQTVEVVWTVTSAEATVDQQVSPLTDPGYTWVVMAADDTYNVNAQIAGFDHGSVSITVAQPTPEPTPEPEPEVAEEPAPEGGIGGGGEDNPADSECLGAAYVADVTIPDNTQMDKGEEFVKTWRMKNTGTCDWPEDTVLAKVQSQTGGPENVGVGTVEPGATVDISVDMAAPDSDGVYDGMWALKAGDTEIPGGRVTVVIVAGEGAGQGAAAAAAVVAPVSGGSFELGGHIRDTGYPYADTMHYAGMNWSKVQVRYPQDATSIIQEAHARGFKIQLSALGTPDMVTQGGFEQSIASWVAGMASAGADAIEVWNEPNIEAEWQVGHIDPAAYTRLLCAAYNAIKAANPGTAVISAATAPTGYFGGCGPNGCDDLPFLQGMYNAGAAQCMDYLGAHHNSGATSPSARSGHPADDGNHHHSWYFLPQTELYFNTFGGTRKLFYTEMGYASQEGLPEFSDWFGWARGINNAQQAAWLAEAVQLSVNTGMVRCIIVWNIDFLRYGHDPQDGYAIIRPGGACPACDSLHNILGTR